MTRTPRSHRCAFGGGVLFLLLATASLLAQAPAAGNLREINPPPAPAEEQSVAIVGARMIDGRGGPAIENAAVVVRGNRIVAAGPADRVTIPAGAQRQDASGLILLPGLIDSHLHSATRTDVAEMFLRNGVTSARDPGVPIEPYLAAEKPGRKAPRMFLTGSHFDQAPPAHPHNAIIIRDARHAKETVDRFVGQGATAIKVYFRLPPDLIAATCEAADAHGIPVTGHLELVDADVAIERGIDGLEHVSSVGTVVAEPDLAEAFRAAVSASNAARHPWRYRLWAGLDLASPRVKRMIDLLVVRGVVLSPTLTYFFGEGPAGRAPTPENQQGFEKMLAFVGRCQAAGVKIVAGSHTMLRVEPKGQALQKEMELLVEAGLSPMQAIAAATLEGAKFLRAERRVGSIEPGKLADLVFVGGDPLRDIRAMRDVRGVMLNGEWVRPIESEK